MLALRRARMPSAPAILRGGFRPFFLGGATWAIVVLALWLTALAGGIALPTAFDPLAWHRHEMLFGFVGSVILRILADGDSKLDWPAPDRRPPLAGLVRAVGCRQSGGLVLDNRRHERCDNC